MKTKKLGLITLIVLSVVFLFTLNASAAWYTCTVTMVGPGGSTQTYVKLTDTSASPAFTNRWFLTRSDRTKEMLATALAASCNTMNVLVNIGDTAQYSTIYNLYLKP